MVLLVSCIDPRISVAVSMFLGLLLSEQLAPHLVFTASVWVVVATLLAIYRRKRTLRTCLLLLLACLTGLLRGDVVAPDGTGLFEGNVTSIRGHRFSLCSRESCIQVSTPRHHVPLVHVGDVIWVRGRLRLAKPPGNPYDIDERRLARSLRVGAFLDEPVWMRIVHPENGLAHRFARARIHVASLIEKRTAHPESAAILIALLTGTRSSLDAETQKQFSDSGLAHLLAVSGLHIGLLALVMLALSRTLFRRFRVSEEFRRALSGLFSIVGITLIAFWMGATPSVSRAAIMGIVLFGAFARRQPYSPWIAWWWALVAGLIASPEAWKTVGFSLSFSAVAAILLYLPTLSRLRTRPFRASLVVSATATLGTAPLLAYHLGQVPISGAIISPLVIPLMAPVLATGAGALLDPGPFSAWIADLLVSLVRHAALWGSRWPEWTRLSGMHVIIWPWLLLVVSVPASRRVRVHRSILACIIASVMISAWPLPPTFHYTQLDVGQGDATSIVLSGKYSVVIDSGASEYHGRVIERHLRALGQRRIDLLIHSHPHADHTGGSRYLAKAMPIVRFVDNSRAHRGDTLTLGGMGQLYVLHPPEQNSHSTNDASLVLRMQIGSTSLLFMGDAEIAAEKEVAASFGSLLDVDIIKVGHHGSRSSSTLPLVTRTSPHTAVVSAGHNNRFDHPHEEIIQAWRAYADSVHVTALRGAYVYERPKSSHQ